MVNILIYGFGGNVSGEIVDRLETGSKFIIRDARKFGAVDINSLVLRVKSNKFDKVLGLGEFNLKSDYHIKVETVAKNIFRNDKIIENGESSYGISKGLETLNVKLSSRPGNSWCNLSTYLLAHNIQLENSLTKLGFVHIHKDIDLDIAYSTVSDIISSWK